MDLPPLLKLSQIVKNTPHIIKFLIFFFLLLKADQ